MIVVLINFLVKPSLHTNFPYFATQGYFMKQTKVTTVTKKTTSPGMSKATQSGMGSLFDKGNLMWMLIGLAVMAVGFLLMGGGRSEDPNVFDRNQVHSFTRITIAPIIILAGLVIEIIAIFKSPKVS